METCQGRKKHLLATDCQQHGRAQMAAAGVAPYMSLDLVKRPSDSSSGAAMEAVP